MDKHTEREGEMQNYNGPKTSIKAYCCNDDLLENMCPRNKSQSGWIDLTNKERDCSDF